MAGWQYTSLLVVFLVGAGVSVGVAGYALRYVREHGPGALVVSVGLLAAHNAVWNVAATLKVASTTLDAKLLFYKLEFFGSAVNPSVALALALAFVGYDRWLTRRTVAALAAVPAVVVALAVVNPGEVMIADPYLVMVDGLVAFEHAFPPLFSAYLAWTLGAVLLSIVVIVAGAYAGRVDWKPAALIAASLAVPLVVASLKVAGVYPPGGDGINVVPAVNTLSITLVAAAVAGYRLFELVPVGRDRAVAVMQDGYLLTDADGVVVDANPAAATLLAGARAGRLVRPRRARRDSHRRPRRSRAGRPGRRRGTGHQRRRDGDRRRGCPDRRRPADAHRGGPNGRGVPLATPRRRSNGRARAGAP